MTIRLGLSLFPLWVATAIALMVGLHFVLPGTPAKFIEGPKTPLERTTRPVHATFLPNVGQWDHPASYVSRQGGMTMFLEKTGWTLSLEEKPRFRPMSLPVPPLETAAEQEILHGVAIRMTFDGAKVNPVIEPGEEADGLYHFFLGNDPAKWRNNVRGLNQLTYRSLYPGIDLQLRQSGRGISYDLLLKPGADLEAVRVIVEGAEGLRMGPEGSLEIVTSLAPLAQSPPKTWVTLPDGSRRLLQSRFEILGPNVFGFNVEEKNQNLAMIIDPELAWSTYVGGTSNEAVIDNLAVDSNGNIVFIGVTASLDYPTTVGAYSRTFGGLVGRYGDAVVTKMSQDGSRLLWSTFLGGSYGDYGYRVFLGPGDHVTAAGITSSSNFPVTAGSFGTVNKGPLGMELSGDGFVTRLTSDGANLIYSGLIGGVDFDIIMALYVEINGEVLVGGTTTSNDFPTTPGSFMPKGPIYTSAFNGFVSRISSDGSNILWSTHIGGGAVDNVIGLKVRPDGNLVLLGGTGSRDFPVTPGAFQVQYGSSSRLSTCFLSIMDSAGTHLKASTFLGGSSMERPYSLALCNNGDIVVGGRVASVDFPATAGAYSTIKKSMGYTTSEPGSGFLVRMNGNLSKVIWGTYFDGSEAESIKGIVLGPNEEIYATGITHSLDYPVTPGAHFRVYGDQWKAGDAFFALFCPEGRRLLWSTYLGGNDCDNGVGIALGKNGLVVLGGNSMSTDFPITAGAFQTTYAGNNPSYPDGDCYLTCLRPGHAGVTRYGTDSPSCLGAVTIYSERAARAGEAGFGFTCWKAPPSSAGLLLLGGRRAVAPIHALGADLWIDPLGVPFVILPAFSDQAGRCTVPLPLPTSVKGARCHAQFIWMNTAACPGKGMLSASDALEVVVQ